MPRSDADKQGIRSLVEVLLRDPAAAGPLLARVRDAVPGEANVARSRAADKGKAILTRKQKDYLREVVAKEHWPRLSDAERQHFATTPLGTPFSESASSSFGWLGLSVKLYLHSDLV